MAPTACALAWQSAVADQLQASAVDVRFVYVQAQLNGSAPAIVVDVRTCRSCGNRKGCQRTIAHALPIDGALR